MTPVCDTQVSWRIRRSSRWWRQNMVRHTPWSSDPLDAHVVAKWILQDKTRLVVTVHTLTSRKHIQMYVLETRTQRGLFQSGCYDMSTNTMHNVACCTCTHWQTRNISPVIMIVMLQTSNTKPLAELLRLIIDTRPFQKRDTLLKYRHWNRNP